MECGSASAVRKEEGLKEWELEGKVLTVDE